MALPPTPTPGTHARKCRHSPPAPAAPPPAAAAAGTLAAPRIQELRGARATSPRSAQDGRRARKPPCGWPRSGSAHAAVEGPAALPAAPLHAPAPALAPAAAAAAAAAAVLLSVYQLCLSTTNFYVAAAAAAAAIVLAMHGALPLEWVASRSAAPAAAAAAGSSMPHCCLRAALPPRPVRPAAAATAVAAAAATSRRTQRYSRAGSSANERAAAAAAAAAAAMWRRCNAAHADLPTVPPSPKRAALRRPHARRTLTRTRRPTAPSALLHLHCIVRCAASVVELWLRAVAEGVLVGARAGGGPGPRTGEDTADGWGKSGVWLGGRMGTFRRHVPAMAGAPM
eukprot:364678-Chlamydomonas_euryale.AAC.4